MQESPFQSLLGSNCPFVSFRFFHLKEPLHTGRCAVATSDPRWEQKLSVPLTISQDLIDYFVTSALELEVYGATPPKKSAPKRLPAGGDAAEAAAARAEAEPEAEIDYSAELADAREQADAFAAKLRLATNRAALAEEALARELRGVQEASLAKHAEIQASLREKTKEHQMLWDETAAWRKEKARLERLNGRRGCGVS